MRIRHWSVVSLMAAAAALTGAAQAQNWEIGALAVASAYRDTDVGSGSRTGSIGFRPGAAGGLLLGQNMGDRLSGEVRYIFAHNDLKLRSGGTEAEFSGQSHVLHYDLLVYSSHRDSPVRFYAAGGGGLKVYQGTGNETAFQPLSNLALLTKTREAMGVVDFGGGVKLRFGHNKVFRAEVRDYITEVPKVFVPAPGAGFSGLFHQWTPTFGFSWTF